MLIRLILSLVFVIAWPRASLAQESVLSGFSPIHFDQTTMQAQLYERVYQWNNSILPSEVTSRSELTGTVKLLWRTNGKEIALTPIMTSVIENTESRLVIEATSTPATGIQVRSRTILDYDGVATISLDITSSKPTTIEGMILEVQVPKRVSHEVLAFRAETIRMRDTGRNDILGNDDVLKVPYAGDLINVLDFSDGERSFWWFADNAVGWDWGSDNPTEVSLRGNAYVLRQSLLGRGVTLSTPKHIEFGILATPVRPMPENWRLQRMTSWLPTAKDKELNAKIFFFWEKGLAYDSLPYAHYPDRVLPRLPASDRALYPGAKENKKTLRKYRDQLGAELLPYYALHLLSTVDPLVVKNRAQWEMNPPEIWRDMVGDYPIRYEKVQISLRAPGVTDHIIEGLASAIDELDANGFYFDHGPIKDSKNPAHGAWIDCKGKVRGSLDIWATRDFFRRLRTEFERRGKPGIVIVHDSNREIIPAYTFVFGLLDGEQFRHELKNGDFLLQTSIAQFRAKFAPGQYGIPTYWLAEEWYNHEIDPSWRNTEGARQAYRKMMGLALLHDVLDWPHEAHPKEREWLLKTLDAFDIAHATFNGYWTDPGLLKSDDADVLISEYDHPTNRQSLYVVVNVGTESKRLQLVGKQGLGSITVEQGIGSSRSIKEGAPIDIRIPARDFALVITKSSGNADTAESPARGTSKRR